MVRALSKHVGGGRAQRPRLPDSTTCLVQEVVHSVILLRGTGIRDVLLERRGLTRVSREFFEPSAFIRFFRARKRLQ